MDGNIDPTIDVVGRPYLMREAHWKRSSDQEMTRHIFSEALAGGVTDTTVTFIVALIIFCILRSKRRHRVVRFTTDLQVPTSSAVRDQHVSQSAQSYTTPRPFLDFPSLQNCSSSKELITDGARNPYVQNQGSIEPVVDPFRDPIPTEGSLLNNDNDDEGQRVRNALNHLQELTSRFERELQQLCILAQSGQLSAENRLKLEDRSLLIAVLAN